ncbi:MAG: branched-chain amino acid transport system permease protein [Acidimicrobiaceae bacterium]|nr:branched-chain amino acid transport system permease protein [Acidimicrobiaceae bacterium]
MAQALVVGLITGGIYGLYALGLVLVFKGSGVLNFAQAELGTFTLFICQSLVTQHGEPWIVGALAALVCAVAMGLVFERFAVWPLRAAPRLTVAVATIALLSLLIALELTIFGPLPRLLAPPVSGIGWRIFDVIVTPAQAMSLVLVLVIGLALAAFLRFTDFGLAVVAAAQDQEAVRFLGIRLARVSLFTWGLAAALSAVAALLIQPTVGVVSASAFGGIFIKALGAALIGGLASMPGAFVGGVAVGVAEAEIRHLTLRSSLAGLPELCIFAAVVATLMVRPAGLLGER